jgi:hypothetical protein
MIVLVLAFAFAVPGVVSAHGHTEVGDYELVIGFHNEPAIQGEPNGLDLFVTKKSTGENVSGLEKTLQAEIVYGDSKKTVTVKPQWGQDGAYTAYVLPTEAGDYTWHIFGTINDTPVDVSMTSSPKTFSSVEAKASMSFPASEPATADLKGAAQSAASTAQTAIIIAVVGLIFGLAGVAVGFLGFQTARRRTA